MVLTLTRRFGGTQRLSAQKPVTGWRLTAIAVGTTVKEARWCAERVANLEATRVLLGGYDLSPLMFESANAPEPDDGWYSAASSWTFSTVPA